MSSYHPRDVVTPTRAHRDEVVMSPTLTQRYHDRRGSSSSLRSVDNNGSDAVSVARKLRRMKRRLLLDFAKEPSSPTSLANASFSSMSSVQGDEKEGDRRRRKPRQRSTSTLPASSSSFSTLASVDD